MKRGDQVRDARKLYDRMLDIVGDEFEDRMDGGDVELTAELAEVFSAMDALEECELLADVLDDMDRGVDPSTAMSKRLAKVAAAERDDEAESTPAALN